MDNLAAKIISNFISSPYFLSDRSFLNTPGISSTEINDEIFALQKKRPAMNAGLPKDFIELLSTWNGFNIFFSPQASPTSFPEVKLEFELFNFGKSEKLIRKFYDVNSKFSTPELLFVGYSDCYCETEKGSSFGAGYVAVDRVGHYWHIDNGADDFHPSHMMGKSIAEVCNYMFAKIP